MRFSQDPSSAMHLIRAYGGGELRIDDEIYRETVIVSASGVVALPELHDMHDLPGLDASIILALDPEVVLLGTGQRQIFPDASLRRRFADAGIGLETMDTGAACRTYNVLATERRRVVAVLML